jgi:dihydrofolate reductase
MRRISLIAAMAHDRIIGADNAMPWQLPADMHRFRQVTLGKPVIMGRQTYVSIGQALPQRENYVLSRDQGFSAAGCHVCHTLDDALFATGEAPEVMVIGGAQIYAEALIHANYLYLTYIDAALVGDVRFPQWRTSEWREVWRESRDADGRNAYAMTFVNLARLASPTRPH